MWSSTLAAAVAAAAVVYIPLLTPCDAVDDSLREVWLNKKFTQNIEEGISRLPAHAIDMMIA